MSCSNLLDDLTTTAIDGLAWTTENENTYQSLVALLNRMIHIALPDRAKAYQLDYVLGRDTLTQSLWHNPYLWHPPEKWLPLSAQGSDWTKAVDYLLIWTETTTRNVYPQSKGPLSNIRLSSDGIYLKQAAWKETHEWSLDAYVEALTFLYNVPDSKDSIMRTGRTAYHLVETSTPLPWLKLMSTMPPRLAVISDPVLPTLDTNG